MKIKNKLLSKIDSLYKIKSSGDFPKSLILQCLKEAEEGDRMISVTAEEADA